jgi:hypothetical protein
MRDPDREVLRTGGKAFHHTGQQPGQPDTHGTAEPTEREALAQPVCHHEALRFRNAMVLGRGPTLAFAGFTVMTLCAVAGMAMFLVPLYSASWARLSDDQSCC